MSVSEILIGLILCAVAMAWLMLIFEHLELEKSSKGFETKKKELDPKYLRLIQMEDDGPIYSEEQLDEFTYYPVKVKSDKDPKDAS